MDGQTESPAESPDEPVHAESASHLDDLVGDADVALVDFHADWCGPCRMLEPVVEEVADRTPATVVTVDVDDHPDVAASFRVQGVPTVVLFDGGQVAERVVGFRDADALAALVDDHAGA